jgi:hypothetical protein
MVFSMTIAYRIANFSKPKHYVLHPKTAKYLKLKILYYLYQIFFDYTRHKLKTHPFSPKTYKTS